MKRTTVAFIKTHINKNWVTWAVSFKPEPSEFVPKAKYSETQVAIKWEWERQEILAIP